MQPKRRALPHSPASKQLILHEGINCLVLDLDGEITPGYGLGFYYDDIRYLSQWQLRLDGKAIQGIGARLVEPNKLISFSTNPSLETIQRERLSIIRTRILSGSIREEIVITNYGDDRASLDLSLLFDADYLDVSKVESMYERGEARDEERRSARSKPLGEGHGLILHTESCGIEIATHIAYDRPFRREGRELRLRVDIDRGEEYRLYAEIAPIVAAEVGRGVKRERGRSDTETIGARRREESRICAKTASLETDHPVLGVAYARAVSDLASLSMARVEGVEAEGRTIAAGVPWYCALFGRDSLTTARLMLLADPELALGTLRILAKLQGKRCEESNQEQPGKILHAYRRNLQKGELFREARYQTLDATPLYLVLACDYVDHQGDLGLIERLWPSVEGAVEWIERFGDFDGDGLLEYDSPSGGGWKDSSDSVRYRDGRIAEPPVALVEVQGYAARGFDRLSRLCEHLGRPDRAATMRAKSERLRELIFSRYWMEDRGFFAQALDGQKRIVDSLTSNPGHLLWHRVLPDEYAKRVARKLVSEAFFSGFGVRTRAEGEGGYNPISYHNGSVWPHENAIIASGLASYGYRDEARELIGGQLRLMAHCERPPEVIAGHSADRYRTPIAYFGANPIQAWASAGIIEMVRTVLGLEVDALAKRVRLSPIGLDGMSYLAWRGVHIGGFRVDIEARFRGERARATIRGLPRGWTLEGARRAEAVESMSIPLGFR